MPSEPAKEEEKPAEKVAEPAPAPASEAPKTASDTSVEREKAVSLVGLEILPGSAYPESPTRGLKYGSMWLTFHGQQWPYMPLIEGEPATRIGLSGYIWNDLSYMHIVPGKEVQSKVGRQNRWTTETRGMLRVTPTYNLKGGWFVQGESEFVVHGDLTLAANPNLASTDDLYVRIGKWKVFDVTVGRFQGWEIANHYGMGLDQNTLERQGAYILGSSAVQKPTDGYGLTYFWDRQDFYLGGYALHVYPTKFLRAEILSHIGEGNATSTPHQLDVRPSAIFDIGFVKVKAGWEYGKAIPMDENGNTRNTKNGYGFAAQFVIDPWVEFGGSFARGFEENLTKDSLPDLPNSNTVQTFGGFINGSPGLKQLTLGLGAFQQSWEDMRYDTTPGRHYGKVDTNDQFLMFGAVQYVLWDKVFFKFVLSHASNHVEHWNQGVYSNNSMGGRLRVMYLF
jgi:hypothetical protein